MNVWLMYSAWCTTQDILPLLGWVQLDIVSWDSPPGLWEEVNVIMSESVSLSHTHRPHIRCPYSKIWTGSLGIEGRSHRTSPPGTRLAYLWGLQECPHTTDSAQPMNGELDLWFYTGRSLWHHGAFPVWDGNSGTLQEDRCYHSTSIWKTPNRVAFSCAPCLPCIGFFPHTLHNF